MTTLVRGLVVQYTDSAGRCHFSNLPFCAYVITAKSEEGCTVRTDQLVQSSSLAAFAKIAKVLTEDATDEQVIRLAGWADICGRAIDDKGAPVGGARIRASHGFESHTRTALADSFGQFRIQFPPTLSYHLAQDAPDLHSESHTKEPFAALPQGDQRLDHVVLCRRPVRIRLQIFDVQQRPVVGAVIDSGEPPGVLFSSDARDYLVGDVSPQRAGDGGVAEFQVPPGLYYQLFVYADGKRPHAEFVDLRIGEHSDVPKVVKRDVILTARGDGELRGVVFDEVGRPVEGAVVRCTALRQRAFASRGSKDIFPEGAVRTLTDEQGSFVLGHLDEETLYQIEAEHPRFRRLEQQDLMLGESVELVMQRPAQIDGVVVSNLGDKVPGARVSVGLTETTTNEVGQFSLPVRCSFPNVIQVECSGFFSEQIGIGDEQKNIHVELYRRRTLAGRLLSPDERPVALSCLVFAFADTDARWKSEPIRMITDELGRFEFSMTTWRPIPGPRRMVVDSECLPDPKWDPELEESFDPDSPPTFLQFGRKK